MTDAEKAKICTTCPLPDCNRRDKRCGLRPKNGTNKRKAYFAQYYADNRDRKLAAAKARHEELKDNRAYRIERSARQTEYVKRKKGAAGCQTS